MGVHGSADREAARALTLERHKDVIRSFLLEHHRPPCMVYSKISDERERQAYLAVQYIRQNGSPPFVSMLNRSLKSPEGFRGFKYAPANDFDEMLGKLAGFITRTGRRPSPDGGTYIERSLSNWMYKVWKNGNEKERRRLERILSNRGITISAFRSREELLDDLERFTKRNGRFPCARLFSTDRSAQVKEEDLLHQFASRVVKSGTDRAAIDRIVDIVVRYDLSNTCDLFVPKEQRIREKKVLKVRL